jgi:hypothetical protein
MLHDLIDAHVTDSAHGTGMNVGAAARQGYGHKERRQDEALIY